MLVQEYLKNDLMYQDIYTTGKKYGIFFISAIFLWGV